MSARKEIAPEVRLFLTRGMQCAHSGDLLEAKGFWSMALERDPRCEVAILCLNLVNEHLESPATTVGRSKPNIPLRVREEGYDIVTFERIREPDATPIPGGLAQKQEREEWGLRIPASPRGSSADPGHTLTGNIFSYLDELATPQGDAVDPRPVSPSGTSGSQRVSSTPTPVPPLTRRSSGGSTPRYKAVTTPPPFRRQSQSGKTQKPVSTTRFSDLESSAGPSKAQPTKNDTDPDEDSSDPWMGLVSRSASDPPEPAAVESAFSAQARRKSSKTKPGFAVPDRLLEGSPTLPEPGEEGASRRVATVDYPPELGEPQRALSRSHLGSERFGDVGIHTGVIPKIQGLQAGSDPLDDPFAILRPDFVLPSRAAHIAQTALREEKVPTESWLAHAQEMASSSPGEKAAPPESLPWLARAQEMASSSPGEQTSAPETTDEASREGPSAGASAQLDGESVKTAADRLRPPEQSLDAVVRMVMLPHQLQGLSLDARKGFVLSRIDGVCSIQDIVDLVHFSAEETMNILRELHEEGIITW